MRKKSLVLVTLGVAVTAWMLCFAVGTPFADKVYVMTGTLSAVDLDYNTAVIKVPIGNGKVFTVGGPLADNAVVKKGGQPALLQDLQVGEKVTVKWRSTDQGHLILALFAK